MCAPILPGDYLRLRREAAGLTIGDVAELISNNPSWAAFNRETIAMIEAGEIEAPETLVARLATAFPFDRRLFDIITGFSRLTRVCAGCGCSDLDRCDDETDGECA